MQNTEYISQPPLQLRVAMQVTFWLLGCKYKDWMEASKNLPYKIAGRHIFFLAVWDRQVFLDHEYTHYTLGMQE